MGSKKIPQHKKLYELLRKHIQTGVYKDGDILPSENDLCSIHNLTRPTVRHALDTLVNDGFIKKQQGKGSIVHLQPKDIGILSIAGTTSAIGVENLTTKILAKASIQGWKFPFMFELSETEKESGCIYIERLRMVNKVPLFLDINYLPNINLSRFCTRNLENKSLFDVLRQYYNIEVTGGEQRLRAIPANKKISKHLNVKEGDPVLHLERKISTSKVGYYFYSSIYCNTAIDAIFGTF